MNDGILFIVSAPSGAGKTSLVRTLLEREPKVQLAVSYTTRAPRPGERDGVDYHFIDEARFVAIAREGAFLEYARVFGHFYGTAEDRVREQLARGRDVFLEIDWQGARQVRERFPAVVSIFVLPPSCSALRDRLSGRGKDSAEVIDVRMAKAKDETSHYREYDYLVVNDVFAEALDEMLCVVRAERSRRSQCEARLRPILDELLGEGAASEPGFKG